MHYCTSRGAALGPVGQDFGAACDQIDRADLMLADLHERARHGLQPSPSRPGQTPTDPASSPWPAATPTARRSASSWTTATANIVMFAAAAHADEREAHIREVEQYGQSLPEGSYGRRNRQAIAARETRVTTRLRAAERAYRTATDRDLAFRPPEPTRTLHSPEHPADREMELE